MAATFYEKDMSALITEYNANISQAKNTNLSGKKYKPKKRCCTLQG